MPIQMKLGTYEADEEETHIFLIGKGGVLILGLLMVLPAVAAFWWSGGPHASEDLLVKGSSASAPGSTDAEAEAERNPYRGFSSTNWSHLEKGDRKPPPKSLDTDQDCPEWEGLDVYRELKAMAVYEVKEKPGRNAEATRPDLLRRMREGRN